MLSNQGSFSWCNFCTFIPIQFIVCHTIFLLSTMRTLISNNSKYPALGMGTRSQKCDLWHWGCLALLLSTSVTYWLVSSHHACTRLPSPSLSLSLSPTPPLPLSSPSPPLCHHRHHPSSSSLWLCHYAHIRSPLPSPTLLRPCKLLAGTPETPELVGVGWDLALTCVLCPCC